MTRTLHWRRIDRVAKKRAVDAERRLLLRLRRLHLITHALCVEGRVAAGEITVFGRRTDHWDKADPIKVRQSPVAPVPAANLSLFAMNAWNSRRRLPLAARDSPTSQ